MLADIFLHRNPQPALDPTLKPTATPRLSNDLSPDPGSHPKGVDRPTRRITFPEEGSNPALRADEGPRVGKRHGRENPEEVDTAGTSLGLETRGASDNQCFVGSASCEDGPSEGSADLHAPDTTGGASGDAEGGNGPPDHGDDDGPGGQASVADKGAPAGAQGPEQPIDGGTAGAGGHGTGPPTSPEGGGYRVRLGRALRTGLKQTIEQGIAKVRRLASQVCAKGALFQALETCIAKDFEDALEEPLFYVPFGAEFADLAQRQGHLVKTSDEGKMATTLVCEPEYQDPLQGGTPLRNLALHP